MRMERNEHRCQCPKPTIKSNAKRIRPHSIELFKLICHAGGCFLEKRRRCSERNNNQENDERQKGHIFTPTCGLEAQKMCTKGTRHHLSMGIGGRFGVRFGAPGVRTTHKDTRRKTTKTPATGNALSLTMRGPKLSLTNNLPETYAIFGAAKSNISCGLPEKECLQT